MTGLSERDFQNFIKRGAVEAMSDTFCDSAATAKHNYLNGANSLLPLLMKAVEALEFYGGSWGPHHGNDERTNLIIMETLNRAGFRARDTLAEIAKTVRGDE